MAADRAMSCILCGHEAAASVVSWKRLIFLCPRCDLRFVDPGQWPSPAEEAERYRLHQNRPEDAGYVRFLWPVVECLRRHVAGGNVLDYGCGPEPVLVGLLRRAGYAASGYDPNFIREEAGTGRTPEGPYDAIVSTEVFEHFRDPAAEMNRLVRWLKPEGTLVVMTGLVNDATRMETWSYANDATHILFYSAATFRYIAGRWGFAWIEQQGDRVIALRRQAHAETRRPK